LCDWSSYVLEYKLDDLHSHKLAKCWLH